MGNLSHSILKEVVALAGFYVPCYNFRFDFCLLGESYCVLVTGVCCYMSLVVWLTLVRSSEFALVDDFIIMMSKKYTSILLWGIVLFGVQ